MELHRDNAVDLTKSIAVFGVLLIHASAVGGYGGTVGSAGWCGALFWGSVLRCAVPLFLMCSGALLLAPDKPVSLRQVWTRYLPRLFTALLFWAAAYEGFALFLTWHRTGSLEPSAIGDALRDLLLFHHKPHLYYLHIALLVYVLLPVLRLLTAAATRRQLEYALLLWLALGVLFPTAALFPPLRGIGGIPAQYGLNLAWGSVGYCLLGWYLKQYAAQRRPRFWAALYAAGFLLTLFATLALSLRRGELYEGFLSGMAPGVCLEAAGLFGLIRTLPQRERPWTRTLSAASFCIYLTHMFPLDFLASHHISAAYFSPVWFVPLASLLFLGFGLVVWLVLRKIPWVNTHLI